MTQEDILAKRRNEKVMMVLGCVFIFIVIFNFVRGRDCYVPMAMLWAFVSAEASFKFRFTKNKRYLILAAAGVIAALVFLGCFAMEYLKTAQQ